MKKFFVIFLLLIFSKAYGATAAVSSSPSGVGTSYNQNSILNVMPAIKANQATMQDKFHNNSVNSSTIVPPPQNFPPPEVGKQHFYPHQVIIAPVSTPKKEEKTTIINNTYIYNTEKGTTEIKAEDKKELSQNEKDEIERMYLRSKYSYILSNTTTSNEKMCSKMEEQFKNADYEELDRLLNNILRLNCDISKLRPF